MRNQYEQIPDHLKDEWEQVSNELHEAAVELDIASKRYNAAILARISILNTLNNSWQ